MEDNKSMPEFCANGCGFYGNPIYNMMCSKCFKDSQKKDPATTATTTPEIAKMETNAIKDKATLQSQPVLPTSPQSTTTTISTDKVAEPSSTPTPPKVKQANKSRCYQCKGRVPLAKQTINKCRCEFVFCDAHRFPDQHACEVDYAKLGKDILTKNVAKISDKPRGGRSFNRIGE